jgi:hypothetical protein
VSQFVDRLLVQLSDPSQLVQLLAPAADSGHARLRTLLGAAFTLDSTIIHDVLSVEVVSAELESPVFPLRRSLGTWTRTIPSYERTDVLYERPDLQSPIWADVAATVGLTLVVEVDPFEVASIVTRDIAGFNSLADFASRFQFIDADAFMAQLGVKTFEELKERYQYLLAEVRLKPQPAFNPADATNQRRASLGVAVLIRDTLDVAACLREAKLVRATMQRSMVSQANGALGEARTPFAPLLVFPEAAIVAPFTADALQRFFAAEGVLALFVTPA